MLMVRPGELRLARWEEFDLDQGLWIVPSERLKRTQARMATSNSSTCGRVKFLQARTGGFSSFLL